jgi:hypothetical protein
VLVAVTVYRVKTLSSVSGYTKIYSTASAFAALKADGTITAWGASSAGGTNAPTGSGYTKIYSTGRSFVAIKTDGTITTWGSSSTGGIQQMRHPTS